jgi:hypothetical protein
MYEKDFFFSIPEMVVMGSRRKVAESENGKRYRV